MITSNWKLLYFYFYVTELVFCGSGQIIHVYGGLTLRMLNFLIAFVVSFFYLIYNPKIEKGPANILFFYFITFFIAVSFSLIGGSTENLFADVKPLSFFFIFPFFYWMMSSERVVMNVVRIIKYCVIAMTIIYLVYLLAMRVFNLVDFYSFYYDGVISEESDFLFRGSKGELFYKGFIYLPVGLVFLLQEKKYFLSLLVLAAIYFTLTRGFYVIGFLAIFLAYLFNSSQSSVKKLFVVIMLSIIVLFVSLYFGLFDVSDNRVSGDQIRLLTMEQVLERVTPFSFLFGHGFGNGVPIRDVHMEMSYLEIFHKQGILGLAFWMYLLYCIYRVYRRINNKYKGIGAAFFISAILIYVQSLFNPYLNNPIGMTSVLLAYFSCRRLAILSSDNAKELVNND